MSNPPPQKPLLLPGIAPHLFPRPAKKTLKESSDSSMSDYAGRREAEARVAAEENEIVPDLLRATIASLTARAEALETIQKLIVLQLRTLILVAQTGNNTALATALEKALEFLAQLSHV
ncbi:hypothetical protein C8F01DRAFT_1088966 [Mycena amicta]|nr:hypothetical protein C8F01DRAFT_1088966 [Mycena amicta]